MVDKKAKSPIGRAAACEGKVVHASPQAGYQALRNIHRERSSIVYHCRYCGKYHTCPKKLKKASKAGLRRYRNRA